SPETTQTTRQRPCKTQRIAERALALQGYFRHPRSNHSDSTTTTNCIIRYPIHNHINFAKISTQSKHFHTQNYTKINKQS
ncbi:hypothetical protein, partial [Burkholderia pseudomallei]|uniref:hypothetical protein n=1 Tax=Burkholderia pseudomallei TaxID=28450 RepID=UPI0019403A2C